MAKKPAAARKRTTSGKTGATRKVRKAASKNAARPKSVKRKIIRPKVAAKRPANARKSAPKKTGGPKRTLAERQTSAKRARKLVTNARLLGRPRLPADARLDFVFQRDYQAREVFAFLGVQTIRELEEFSPDEIIRRLTGPMVQTVERIRKALALSNRSLLKDRDFALKFKGRASR
ncbi:MAG: hypothetical protein WD648_01310 [Planctomycetaceae bacterium]